ncbi:MAG: hypothetical protein AAAB35_28360 [Phyllobacterium sp.]|uniref:hypothetical protein n=1 Tax=Phyllobacterium sp. TaxID=1871046 RepID=UPI0030F1BA91
MDSQISEMEAVVAQGGVSTSLTRGSFVAGLTLLAGSAAVLVAADNADAETKASVHAYELSTQRSGCVDMKSLASTSASKPVAT